MINKKKSICIIGGGFYGCYIAKKIKENFKNVKIEIFEKNDEIISEAGQNNQYRLHLGFHYPRSIQTIKQTQEGSKIFTKEFKDYLSKPKKNIYLIHKNSVVNFKKYKKIFNKLKIKFNEIDLSEIKILKNTNMFEGAINTHEQVILLDKLIPKIRTFVKKNCIINYKSEIKKIHSKFGIIYHNKNNFKKFDYILNTTYTNPNLGLKSKYKIKYEIAGMVKIKNTLKNTAVTIMDGPYVSLYPRNNKELSISSVKFTPIKKFRKLNDLKKNIKQAMKKKNKIIKKIIHHSDEYFNSNLKIIKKGFILAPKVKIVNDKRSERLALVRKNYKTLSVLCGKLDAAPLAFQKIKELINFNS